MDIARFQRSPIGHLEPIAVSEGEQEWRHYAFIPDPLPDTVDLTTATWTAVTEASAALARLDGAAHRLPNPYLLVRPALTKEAVSTSALEGTYAAVEDVLQAELLAESELSASTAEVRNYVRAAERGLELIKTLPVCQRLVTEAHKVLMQGSRGDHAEIGAFRRRQNWIGTRRSSPVTESLFVPPPAGDALAAGLDAWEKWVNRPLPELPSLVRVAMAHYQFETLHPFIDGNGRVGRLLIVLTLMEHGDLEIPLLNVSPFFEDARDEYIDHLRRVSETGDFEPWIAFFAEAVKTQSERALAKADELIGLRDELLATAHAAKVRGVGLRIVEDLIGSPYVTPTRAAEKFSVSYEAANSAISRLEHLGLLTEATGRAYGRMFLNPRVVVLVKR